MAITYDFIVYSSRTSETSWVLGMKAVHGEVPLDIVVPHEYGKSDSDDSDAEVVGVLTTQGLERESTDGLELYRYLRQLNPKQNNSFGYNEVVIRNIHGRLSTLQIDEEIRVQITYSERRKSYTVFSYHIKLIGIFGSPTPSVRATSSDEIATPDQPEDSPQLSFETSPQPQSQKNVSSSEPQVYKTTNTLEKLIAFAQNLQKELTQTRRDLAVMVDRVQQLEGERQQLSEIQDVVEDVFDRLNRLERFDSRIQDLEVGRHQLQELQQTLRKFLSALHHQTRVSLQRHDDEDTDLPNDHT